jgi:uncharacterized membrane protein YedE/YeeE
VLRLDVRARLALFVQRGGLRLEVSDAMEWTWIVRGVIGGALIGAAASMLYLMNGRIAGVSGILHGLLAGQPGERRWRALFVLGLVAGAVLAALVVPDALSGAPPALGIAVASGLLVGAGTKLGNGCTSGHGVCGVGRMSARSIVATLTFVGTGALSVLLSRGLAS